MVIFWSSIGAIVAIIITYFGYRRQYSNKQDDIIKALMGYHFDELDKIKKSHTVYIWKNMGKPEINSPFWIRVDKERIVISHTGHSNSGYYPGSDMERGHHIIDIPEFKGLHANKFTRSKIKSLTKLKNDMGSSIDYELRFDQNLHNLIVVIIKNQMF